MASVCVCVKGSRGRLDGRAALRGIVAEPKVEYTKRLEKFLLLLVLSFLQQQKPTRAPAAPMQASFQIFRRKGQKNYQRVIKMQPRSLYLPDFARTRILEALIKEEVG